MTHTYDPETGRTVPQAGNRVHMWKNHTCVGVMLLQMVQRECAVPDDINEAIERYIATVKAERHD